jgi:hypothetical protein
MRNGAGSGDAPPRAMLGSAFRIRRAGYARLTGDAESRELQHLADGQMNSERHAVPRCDLRDMSRG